MSANHIPHLLTRLMTESELDALRAEFDARVEQTTGEARIAWLEACILLVKARTASFERRARQTPSARRKSLGCRPAAASAH